MKRYYAVDNKAMILSKLSLMEWCILENIHFLSTQTGWCYASKKDLAKHHDITERNFLRIRRNLEEKEWLKSNNKGHLKVTKKWYDKMSDHDKMSHDKMSDEPMTKCPTYPIKEENLSVESNVTHKKNLNMTTFIPNELQIANHLFSKIKTVKPNFKEPNINKWAKDIYDAIRIDKRTYNELIGCIDWIYSTSKGAFWIPNIMSGYKLRKQFDQMEMQMMKPKSSSALDKFLESNNAS